MNSKKAYYDSILKRYLPELSGTVLIDIENMGTGRVILRSTEVHSESRTGLVIVPGITVPRESYYRLLAGFSNLNVLVYDLRGQASSGGKLSYEACVQDINIVGRVFKKKRHLDFLVGIGHSFGGLTLLRSSLEKGHPYDLRICLATPVDLTRVSSKIPEWKTALLLYSHNIFRALMSQSLRDEIVRHHQSFWLTSFLRDPRIVSLRLNDPEAFNATRIFTPKLTDFVMDVPSPSCFIYGEMTTDLVYKQNFQGITRNCASSLTQGVFNLVLSKDYRTGSISAGKKSLFCHITMMISL